MKQPIPNQANPQAYPAAGTAQPLATQPPISNQPVQPPVQGTNPPIPSQNAAPAAQQAQTSVQTPASPAVHSAGQPVLPKQPAFPPMPQTPAQPVQNQQIHQQTGFEHAHPVHQEMNAADPNKLLDSVEEREGGEKALPRISIHAFCEHNQTAATVQESTRDWRMARTNVKIYMGGLPAAIEFYKKENTPAVIIFESSRRGPELFAQLERLASVCDADTKVVMIGAVNDIRLYRELMEQGLSEYLVPPFHPLTLIRSIGDLYADPDNPFIGKVIAFFGAKGGVGSSTMAHNLAWGMSSKMSQETALVDLDASWGTTGLDFNYDNTKGIEEALADHERLDDTLLDRIMIRHTEKLSILPAAASLGNIQPAAVEAYETLVNGVRSISPMTILDIPHIWSEWSSELLKSADEIVITATPDLANLRNAKNLVEYLKSARPNDPEPLLILNKTGVPKTNEIPIKDFASAVGVEPAVVLGYDPVTYTEAANDGKMLSDIKTGAPAFEGIMYLAHRLKTGTFPPAPLVAKGKKGKKPKKTKALKAEKTKKAGKKEKKPGLFAKLKKRK